MVRSGTAGIWEPNVSFQMFRRRGRTRTASRGCLGSAAVARAYRQLLAPLACTQVDLCFRS